jgi:uncharacterized membrane protein
MRVAGLAAGTYLIVAVAAALLSLPNEPLIVRGIAIGVLATAAPVLAISALWFVGIQGIALRRFCAYCLLVHVLGLAAAALIIASSPRFSDLRSATVYTPPVATLTGLVLVTLFIVGQLVLRPTTYQHSTAPLGDATAIGAAA